MISSSTMNTCPEELKNKEIFSKDLEALEPDEAIMVFGKTIHEGGESASMVSIESIEFDKMPQDECDDFDLIKKLDSSNGKKKTPSPRGRKKKMNKKKKIARSKAKLLPLPDDFKPLPYSVILGKSKEAKECTGNLRLRVLASVYLPKYEEASSNKSKKSQIVSSVVEMIHDACPEGAFIRQGNDGAWSRVSDSVAREKVGYTFRELLGENYKSSSTAKRQKRDLVLACTAIQKSMRPLPQFRNFAMAQLHVPKIPEDSSPIPVDSVLSLPAVSEIPMMDVDDYSSDTSIYSCDDSITIIPEDWNSLL